MPRRDDLSSVLVIGSGPIVIGQACEFDYSGTQACRVLRNEGMRVILINSNPATIMTDPGVADATYIEPLTPEVLEKIIEKERPDALLPTLGGQTALNAAMSLVENGVLERYNVELIGARAEAITKGEDREEFKKVVEKCGGESARSFICHTMDECFAAAQELGYPLVVRPSFTMGGLGSGFAHTPEELERIAGQGLHFSATTEVLLEESILGWKEYELEIMRDSADNVVVVCSIENVDPVGVHTGDSITVAPALTLTDREYQRLRDIGIAIIREVGVDTGGCNIQFAVNPRNGRIIVIEMNPRVSRSSALASKATGFPIAKIAARLALGYTLDEIPNDITQSTPASFEPTLDYVVVKVPRFAFEKFPDADTTLTTTMKSVGESMALGRNFTEALNKAMRSIDKKSVVFHWNGETPGREEALRLLEEARVPTETRLVTLQQALRGPITLEEACEATSIDPWFIDQIQLINEVAQEVARGEALSREALALAKRHGFSDAQISDIRSIDEEAVRQVRWAYGLHPVYKTVDTCAAEFAALTPYHYSTYDEQTEVVPRERPAILILGSGPNRIGQGIEFDYSCVHAAQTLASHYETVMINCNPETVSTDYDVANRLYFEPLTLEDVLEVYRAEKEAGPIAGVLVQLGGQTPLSLATALAEHGVPIIGTSSAAIDAAEDREHFGLVLENAGLRAPEYGTAINDAQTIAIAERIGYPVLVRPSYVLGGRGMEIIYSREQLDDYLARRESEHTDASRRAAPLLVDRFLDSAVEIDVDALYDGEELFLAGVMEHIEECGIHSGDSSCVLPPVTLSQYTVGEIRRATQAIAKGVGVRGLLNIQFGLLHDQLYVIEANPRASRTVPFVSKATGVPVAQAAAWIMAGKTIAQLREEGMLPETDASVLDIDSPISVKGVVLPFKRFQTSSGQVVDSVLGPEMRSTGEAMGISSNFPKAFAKAQAGITGGLPNEGTIFISVRDEDKGAVVLPALQLAELGFRILATTGTAIVLNRYGVPAEVVRKKSEGQGESGEPTIVDLVSNGQVDMVINTPGSRESRSDGYALRAASTSADKTIITTAQSFAAAVQAIIARRSTPVEVTSLQEYDHQRRQRRA